MLLLRRELLIAAGAVMVSGCMRRRQPPRKPPAYRPRQRSGDSLAAMHRVPITMYMTDW